MKKTIMIGQPFGIGDVLFIQKIIFHYVSLGFRVVVPLLNSISWMRYYLKPHPDVEYPIVLSRGGIWTGTFEHADVFVSLYGGSLHDGSNPLYRTPIAYNQGDAETGFIFIPLGATYERPGTKLMPSKYEFVGLDHKGWTRFVHLKRRAPVERELFYEVLGLKDDTKFTLVNYQSSRSSLAFDVPGTTVELRKIEGFTLFDWSLVIERSAQIVTIDTSLVLLAEILNQAKPLYIISRYDPPSFSEIEDVLSLPWTFVPTGADLTVGPAA